MTTPTNRPPDDGLEERLAAGFDRATRRAEADLADSRLAAEAIDRGRRRIRSASMWRVGLVVAVVAVLGAGTLLVVGGRPAPSPSPAPSLAAAPQTPSTTASLLPTDANGSEIPYPSLGTPVPLVDQSFPPSMDGQPVLDVGGPAESAIAKATDDGPIYVSGWLVPMLARTGCGDFGAGASLTPDGIDFRACAAQTFFEAAEGGASIGFYRSHDMPISASVDGQFPDLAHANRVLVRVHVHDAGCQSADCQAKPVIDAYLMTGKARWAPGILTSSMPPNGLTVDQAIAQGLAAARESVTGTFGPGASDLRLLSITAGPRAVVNPLSGDGPTQWVWQLVAATSDGRITVTITFDYVTGTSSGYSGATDR